ncbi:MAG: hypothetical protein L0211_05855 [Planctomycetaceae bacterium]|nr:hypothetical protein [Planctomycetaceae bacterium]
MSLSSNAPETSGQPPAAFDALLSLQKRVDAAETAKLTRVGADWRPTDALVEQIKQITQSLFPGEVQTEIDCDPSEPDDPWINFWVTSDLEYPQIRVLRDRWHEDVSKLGIGDESRYRLLVGHS